MANFRIDDLPAASALTGAELVEVEQDDTGLKNRKATVQDIADLAAAGTTVEPNVQTASYTLVADDAGKAVEMDVAGANDLTVPPDSSVAFPVGTIVEVCQVGAGQTTVVAGSGVTIRSPQTLLLVGQWSSVSLRKRAADEWVLAGDVEASP
jgi:hypothetical protein